MAGESTSYDEQNELEDNKDNMKPRRTRASRACLACHKRHLACGDERPCQQCIRDCLADSCKDGITERATYSHSTVSFPNIAAHGPGRCSWQQAQTEYSNPRLTLPLNPCFSSASAQPAPIPHLHHTQFTTCATLASSQQHPPLPPRSRYQLPLQVPQQQQQDRGPSLQQNVVKKHASRAGTRCVSRLSAAQLARKRAIDRENQRVSRERTKENIETFERQIEEQKRQIEEQNLSLEWMKQRYSQLETEMRAQEAVMTQMLNATSPSNQNNDYSGLDVPLCMPQNIYENIGSMRWVDSSDATEGIRLAKSPGADFTPSYPPISLSSSTPPVFG